MKRWALASLALTVTTAAFAQESRYNDLANTIPARLSDRRDGAAAYG